MNNNLYGISGQLKSGKDLVSEMLMYIDSSISSDKLPLFDDFKLGSLYFSKYHIKKCADKLKECVCLILGCTREQLEDQEFKSEELGPEWWVYEIKHSTNGETQLFTYIGASKQTIDYGTLIKLTPRKILQILGTQGSRMLISPIIWVNALFSSYRPINDKKEWELQMIYPSWIITDIRFPDNEGKAVLSRGGLMIGIKRFFRLRFPELANIEVKSDPYAIPKCLKDLDPELYKNLTHESESEMGDYSWCDVVIENNGTIEDLYNNVLNAVHVF